MINVPSLNSMSYSQYAAYNSFCDSTEVDIIVKSKPLSYN